jgi:hypothetical protein
MAVSVNVESLTNNLNKLFAKYIKIVDNFKNPKLVAKEQIKSLINELNEENMKIT